VEHETEELGTAAQSPTEQLPALEHGAQLPGGEDGAEVPASEYEAARVLLRYLKDRVRDLDRDLPPAAQAEVLALTSLVQCQLEAASIYTTWMEGTSYSKFTKAAHGGSLPFPMNHWVPWRTRQAMAEHFKAHSATQIYEGAKQAYASLAQQMEKHNSGEVKFFFGDKPSSVDAVLYPHLLYHHRSPVAAPELRSALQQHPVLVKYIDSVAAATRTMVPKRPPRARSGWERPAEENPARQDTASERRLKQSGQVWLAAAAAVVVAYVILTGQWASTEYEFEDEDDE
jgi:metaxin